jgi:hypothetical protein
MDGKILQKVPGRFEFGRKKHPAQQIIAALDAF